MGQEDPERARWLTLEAGEAIPVEIFEDYVREAARVAGLSSSEQGAILLDLEAAVRGLPVELLSRAVGPVATNVHILADPATREAIAIDTAIPSLAWIGGELAARGWTLKLIISTHGHWDHIGDNAALAAETGAPIAVHPLDRERLVHPQPIAAPFEIPPSVPAVELAEGGLIRFGSLRLDVLHTPGHTEGSVCLLAAG